MDSEGAILHSYESERATTPTSPYDRFKPNSRNLIRKPLLGDNASNRWGNSNTLKPLRTTTNRQGANEIFSPAGESEKDPHNTATDIHNQNKQAE